MKYARVVSTGELINLEEFYLREGKTNSRQKVLDGKKGWQTHIVCPDCGGKVHPNNAAAAKGFRSVAVEVAETRSIKDFPIAGLVTTQKRKRKLPGFDHHDHAAAPDCPSSFVHDPRFSEIYRSNTFDFRERERNADALQDSQKLEALKEVLKFFMQRLTGSPLLSAEDEKFFDKLTKQRLFPLVGLAEHSWVLPYMQVLLAGTRERTFKSKKVSRIAYKNIGQQVLYSTDVDGQPHKMIVPTQIQLGFVSKKGKFKAMQDKDGAIIAFEVSRNFAAGIVRKWRPDLLRPLPAKEPVIAPLPLQHRLPLLGGSAAPPTRSRVGKPGEKKQRRMPQRDPA